MKNDINPQDFKSHTKFFNSKSQIIGDLVDRVFYKRVKSSRHLFRMYDAWGIEEHILDKIKGADEIRILDEDTGIIYSTTPRVFAEKGIKGNFQTPQVFLPRKEFIKEDSNQQTLYEIN